MKLVSEELEFLYMYQLPVHLTGEQSRCLLDVTFSGVNLLDAPLVPRRDTTYETKWVVLLSVLLDNATNKFSLLVYKMKTRSQTLRFMRSKIDNLKSMRRYNFGDAM